MDSPGIRAAVGLALLCLALVFLVPPFGAADEADHHTRIQGVASGTLAGPQAEPTSVDLTALQRPWVRQTTRAVHVPAGLSSQGGFGCYAASAAVGAACIDRAVVNSRGRTEATPVGTYQPLTYLLPAAVARVAGSPAAADRWERVATLLPALALLLGTVLLVGPSRILLTGVVLAASPAVLLVAAALGGSGLEVCAAIALVAALVVPAVLPGRATSALRLMTIAAPALVLARPLGPVWVVVLALAAAPLGWPWLRALDRRRLIAPGAAITAAVLVQRWWEGRYGPTPPDYGIPPAFASLKAGVRALPDTMRESVGADGYLQLLAPWPLALLWLAAVATLVAAAVVRSPGRRARVHVLLVAGAALTSAPVLFAVATRYTGFGVQARHVLPLLAAVPVVAAGLLARSAAADLPSGWTTRLPGILTAAAGAVHLGLLLILAHRYAVGTRGPVWFLGDGWSPPGGWLPVLLLTLTGAGLVASAGADLTRWRRAPGAPGPPAAR